MIFACYSESITSDLCGLGTASYPITHFTTASGNSSKGSEYVLHGADGQTYTPEVHKTALSYCIWRNSNILEKENGWCKYTWTKPGHLGS